MGVFVQTKKPVDNKEMIFDKVNVDPDDNSRFNDDHLQLCYNGKIKMYYLLTLSGPDNIISCILKSFCPGFQQQTRNDMIREFRQLIVAEVSREGSMKKFNIEKKKHKREIIESCSSDQQPSRAALLVFSELTKITIVFVTKTTTRTIEPLTGKSKFKVYLVGGSEEYSLLLFVDSFLKTFVVESDKMIEKEIQKLIKQFQK